MLQSEAQGSAVNRVQHSAIQVDVISCWTHQTGHILRKASLVNLHNDGQSKAGAQPVENKITQWNLLELKALNKYKSQTVTEITEL